MKTKPDEATLMAYLCNELGPEERQRVEDYLAADAALRQEVMELGNVKNILGSIQDKEVIAPSFIFPDAPVSAPWLSRFTKMSLGIAAALTLLVVTVALVGVRITRSEGELVIRIGTPRGEQTEPLPALNAETVQRMIDQSWERNSRDWQANLEKSRDEWDKSVRAALLANSGNVSDLVSQVAGASKSEVQKYVADLHEQNQQAVKNYMELSANEQKIYIENLLIDFSKYLREQRSQDLQLFQTRIGNIEKNTGQFQHETEQILAGIISSANPKTKLTSY